MSAPPLHDGGLALDALEGGLLRTGDGERGGEQQPDEHHGGDGEGGERGGEPADGEGVSGQTGQDRSRSPEAGEDVAEPKQREAGDRFFPAQAGLPTGDRRGEPLNVVHRGRQHPCLHQPEQD